MARQRGPLKVQGTLGDLNFYKSQDGFLIREKGGVDAKRIKNDPAFQRTRENGMEFGRAGKDGKLLRTALRQVLLHADNRLVSRMQRAMMLVLKEDPVNARGKRTVAGGRLDLLKDFEFNINSPLSSLFFALYTVTINRVTGIIALDIPSFDPTNVLFAPSGTTHFKIISCGATVNFEDRTFVSLTDASAVMPWDSTPTAALSHSHAVTANSTDAMFLVLTLQFYQEVNGEYYLLHNGIYNSSAVLRVDQV
ncbi:hypothetical protein [Flavobacterium macrobrachii]|uniref:Uncharacterized protein n=1 Tax=Flavobacterium macrobrachii TaxID=591204 RepID=A0ABS2CUI9_9FLAO|nr:hypothetical protein [Flavobacterium macrobrachii]MBM6498632.1 hypothetical protein [Flavobacterium macrobrachii]